MCRHRNVVLRRRMAQAAAGLDMIELGLVDCLAGVGVAVSSNQIRAKKMPRRQR